MNPYGHERRRIWPCGLVLLQPGALAGLVSEDEQAPGRDEQAPRRLTRSVTPQLRGRDTILEPYRLMRSLPPMNFTFSVIGTSLRRSHASTNASPRAAALA